MPPSKRNLSDGPAPRYHRVFTVLREKILSGAYSSEDPMPGEVELAAMFDVSRVTIRRALERLQQEGLVHRRQGVGTFACPDGIALTHKGDLCGFIDNLLSFGLHTEVRVIEFEYMAPPPEIRQTLALGDSEIVQRAVRLRSYQGKPLSHATTYIPEPIGRTFSRAELESERLLELLNRGSSGIASAHQRISATAADPAIAGLLDVDYGAPLLCITRTVRDRDDVAINHLRALYRPDSYEFALELSTDSSPQGPLWQATSDLNIGAEGDSELTTGRLRPAE